MTWWEVGQHRFSHFSQLVLVELSNIYDEEGGFREDRFSNFSRPVLVELAIIYDEEGGFRGKL